MPWAFGEGCAPSKRTATDPRWVLTTADPDVRNTTLPEVRARNCARASVWPWFASKASGNATGERRGFGACAAAMAAIAAVASRRRGDNQIAQGDFLRDISMFNNFGQVRGMRARSFGPASSGWAEPLPNHL